ncbi:NfeD family protein [Lysinibacillus sp. KU-BSD001]|uniref:NfeD family protein n=1 Tax=Lysinibacillus sp. KU-BSD001 TaxID=3141328 RepID=UPI0036F1811E
MLFGFSLATVYLTILIVIGLATILYLFFADVADGVAEGIPFFDPAIMLAFITITAAGGYLLEKFANLSHVFVLLLALFISFVSTALLYYFFLVPLRSAETSLAYTDESLAGQTGRVITPIPIDGFGEILIETASGIINKRAASYNHVEIPYDEEVLVIEVLDGTVYVQVYETVFPKI